MVCEEDQFMWSTETSERMVSIPQLERCGIGPPICSPSLCAHRRQVQCPPSSLIRRRQKNRNKKDKNKKLQEERERRAKRSQTATLRWSSPWLERPFQARASYGGSLGRGPCTCWGAEASDVINGASASTCQLLYKPTHKKMLPLPMDACVLASPSETAYYPSITV